MVMRRFSDEELTAYLDDEMTAADAKALTAALKGDAALRARLDSLSFDRGSLDEAFAAVLADAPEPPDQLDSSDKAGSRTKTRARWAVAAAAAVGFVVGASTLPLLTEDGSDSWHQAAAIYHKLYVTETLTPVMPSNEQLSRELARVSESLQRDIRLGELNGLDALSPRRAQVLSFADQPLVQIAFLSDDGVPVALCILRSEQAEEAAIDLEAMEGMSAATWSRDGYEFMLIGGTDDDRIYAAAEILSGRL